MLIFGPNGELFATPQADPTFSGAPSQPPTIDPLPTSTTASNSVTSSSYSPTALSNLQTVLTDLTLTETATSLVYIVSCPVGVLNCLQDSSTSDTTISTSTITQISIPTSTITSLYITDGGSRPATPIATSSSTAAPPSSTSQTSRTSAGSLRDPVQATFINRVHYTEYRIQTVEICVATSTSCSQSTSTATVVGDRTEISCSPGLCSGLIVAASLTADVSATGTCIRL